MDNLRCYDMEQSAKNKTGDLDYINIFKVPDIRQRVINQNQAK